MDRISVIDSHTEGEPTRIIVSGGPDLGSGSITSRLRVFRERFDHIRSAVVNEPRGCEHLVGALLCSPVNPNAAAGVIFFNNVGFLNGCGHGTIGLAATLLHMGKIGPGLHLIETPVGDVTVTVGADNAISITNIPSYRHKSAVDVTIQWRGARRTIRGDIAWGGNWFFLVGDHGEHGHGHGQELSMGNLEALTELTAAIRAGLDAAGITGAQGGVIDHIELFGPPTRADCHSKNFVLCPGKQYDRSPCGTGTSAKLACLAADGKLRAGAVWGQESIIGSAFFGTYAAAHGAGAEPEGAIVPTITGKAWVTSESTLVMDPTDPFRHGISS